MSQIKIAFAGQMGVGKSTAVNYLLNKFDSQEVSFAHPLYELQNHIQTFCGIPNKKDRKLLQFIGTWGRSYNQNIWVEILLKKVENIDKNIIFLSDLRFKNEYEHLKKNNWIIILIKKQEISNIIDIIGTGDHNHESELDLFNIDERFFDYVINNNTTLDDFYNELEIIISKILN